MRNDINYLIGFLHHYRCLSLSPFPLEQRPVMEVACSSSATTEVGSLEAALDLLRRLPPQRVEANLLALARLLPHHTSQLLNIVDVPAKVRVCGRTGRDYLVCDYNRDGDSYRSPWSNEYEPPVVEGSPLKPDERLRRLEVVANEAFDTYRNLYYEGGVSSVYIWDSRGVQEDPAETKQMDGDEGQQQDTSKDGIQDSGLDKFTMAVLIKKETEAGDGIRSGAWDAMHIVEVSVGREPSVEAITAEYKLTTTVTLHLDTAVAKLDSFLLAGNITRQSQQRATLGSRAIEEHIPHIGRLVEDMESRMRSSLQEIYFGKTHDLINEIRPVMPAGYLRHQADLQREMLGRLALKKVTEQ